jgi:hypothetical protein
MRTHIKVVGLVNLLYSAIGLLAAAGVLLGGIFGSLATLNPIVLLVGTVTSALIAVVIGAMSVFGLVAGFALLNHQSGPAMSFWSCRPSGCSAGRGAPCSAVTRSGC